MRTQPVRVAIDLETTGLHAEQDAVIEIGALKFAGDETIESFESFVTPGIPLPYRIQRLTGITPARLHGAPTLDDLVPRLRAFLGDAPLVGHSVQFDAAFLRRHGLARRNPLVDTYELASVLLPSLSSYTLASVGAALNVRSPTYHRALADAQLARDVFLALLKLLDDLDLTTLDALRKLAAPPGWTPGYFIRHAAYPQHRDADHNAGAFGALAGGTLGDQLAAKLGVDPAVLSLAIAPSGGRTRQRQRPTVGGTLPVAALSPDIAQAADMAEEALSQTIQTYVSACFDEGGALLVEVQNDEAGILACLMPTLRWAKEHDERVLVGVADGEAAGAMAQRLIPQACAAAGLAPDDVRVAELSERESYLCLHRWFGAARTARDSQLSLDVARGLAKLTVWASQTQTGARTEVALAGQEMEAWERARAGPEFADSNPACAYRRDGYCFVARAQKATEEAQIVVTTHATLAAHLAGADLTLPGTTRTLLFDAQRLEEELRRARSCALDRYELLSRLAVLAEVESGGRRAGLLHLAAARMPSGGSSREQAWFAQVERARQGAERFFQTALRLFNESRNEAESQAVSGDAPEQRALQLDAPTRQLSAFPELVQAWRALSERLGGVVKVAREAGQLVLAARGPTAPVASDGVASDLYAFARLLGTLCQHGDTILVANGDPTSVAWLRVPYPQTSATSPTTPEQRRRGRGNGGRGHRSKPHDDQPQAPILVQSASANAQTPTSSAPGELVEAPTLHSAPRQVGVLLEPLYAPGHGLVLAAPSLAVAGDFTYARVSLGLPEQTQTLGPAMDRAEQTLLCLPTDVPEPHAPQYQRHLDEALTRLAVALGGRLVVILPSHAALRAAALGIRRALERDNILVLGQGQDGSARQLWQTFRTESRVVLLGAGTFWEGAEQVEQPPACVVVTRIPFPALSDPLLAVRAEAWSDPQSQFVVPQAALRLRQALGGLAWSTWRRNAVVLFDRRLQTRGYGPTILGTLPRCTQYQEAMAQVVERVSDWVGI